MANKNRISKIFSRLADKRVLLLAAIFAITLPAQAVDVYMQAVHGGVSRYPQYPKIDYGTGSQASHIQNGEILAKAGDCIACHTEPGGVSFAGGLKIDSAFGAIYTPNITPDKETGIGTWTNDQFYRAMHDGISPKGHYYYPAFPYVYFNRMTKQDIDDIKAYLDVLPAVHKPNHKNELKWPFSIRFLQSGWRLLFFDFSKGTYQPDSHKSEEWNRGAYLVNGPGHCDMCHTEMYYLFSQKYMIGATKHKYFLAGGFVDGFYAPNITSTSFSQTPIHKITDVFLKDKLVSGGDVLGPMLEVNHDSLSYLSVTDLANIAIYLKTVKSKTPPAAHISGAGAGKTVYNKYCVGCHGTGAGGAPKFGDAQDWAPPIKLGLNNLYKNAIVGIGGMPPKGTCATCTDKQIEDAVDYIVDNSSPKAGETITAAAPAFVANTTIARGKVVYDQVCSVCHSSGQLGAQKLGDKTAWSPVIKNNMDVLISRSINGYKGMPARGACYHCTDADIIAAVKYMVQKSTPAGNYKLW